MTKLEELLATMSEDRDKGAGTDPVAEPAVDTGDDPDSLDDGPVLTGRLWPSALPRPEARQTSSGLIDVRAMAAAYRNAAAEPIPVAAPLVAPAEGTQPVVILESAPARAARRRGRSHLARALGGAALFALGGVAFALVTLIDRRTAPPLAEEPWPIAVGSLPASAEASAAAAPREPAIPYAQPAADAPPEGGPPLETVVIELPTTVTEVSEPSGQLEPPDGDRTESSGPTHAPARLPIRPSNSEIANAIVAAQGDLERCSEAYGTSGLVPIEIEVAPGGTITSVAVGLGSTGFRDCIQDSVRRQSLPASRQGTTAKFRIVVSRRAQGGAGRP